MEPMNLREKFENLEWMRNPCLLKNALTDKTFDCSDLNVMGCANAWSSIPAADRRLYDN